MTALTLPDGATIDPAMVHRMLAFYPRAVGTRKATLDRELVTIGLRLQKRRIELAGPDGCSGQLGTGMDYLEQHDDDERFAVWQGWLLDYVTVCGLQDAIVAGLGGA